MANFPHAKRLNNETLYINRSKVTYVKAFQHEKDTAENGLHLGKVKQLQCSQVQLQINIVADMVEGTLEYDLITV